CSPRTPFRRARRAEMGISADGRVERIATEETPLGLWLGLARDATDLRPDGRLKPGGERAGRPGRWGRCGRLGRPGGMPAAGGRRPGLPARDQTEGLQGADVLADGPVDLAIRARAGRLLALLDGDLVDGGVIVRLLAQRPDDLEAGGRGERVET